MPAIIDPQLSPEEQAQYREFYRQTFAGQSDELVAQMDALGEALVGDLRGLGSKMLAELKRRIRQMQESKDA